MSEIKLLPCPFCGEEAVIHVNEGVRIICRKCGTSTKCLVDVYSQGRPDGNAIKTVVKAWNTRKPLERIVEQLEEQRMSLFLTIANTCDKSLDLAYEKCSGLLDKVIEIVQKGGADDA